MAPGRSPLPNGERGWFHQQTGGYESPRPTPDFDQNLSLTAGEPAKQSMMLAYNIYDTFYARSGPQWKGIGQAKAVVFFLFVVVISLLQLHFTRSKEVQA